MERSLALLDKLIDEIAALPSASTINTYPPVPEKAGNPLSLNTQSETQKVTKRTSALPLPQNSIDNCVLYLFSEPQRTTLEIAKIQKGVVLCFNPNGSSSSSGSRAYNAYFVERGRWVTGVNGILKIEMGDLNLSAFQEGELEPNSETLQIIQRAEDKRSQLYNQFPTPFSAGSPLQWRYVTLMKASISTGIKMEFFATAFFKKPPLGVLVSIGYDQPTKRCFLYIEGGGAAYSSPLQLDGCFYNSLLDSRHHILPTHSEEFVPEYGDLLRFLDIFERYKIFISIEIYEVLMDFKRREKSGYVADVEDISYTAYDLYKENSSDYYREFRNLIAQHNYIDPLDKRDDDNVSEKKELLEKKDDTVQEPKKDRLLLGEADFSFAAAFALKHSSKASLLKKTIATEYRSESDVKKLYKGWDLYWLTKPLNKKIIKNFGNAMVLEGEELVKLKVSFIEMDKTGISMLKTKKNSRDLLTFELNFSEKCHILTRRDLSTGKVERAIETVDEIDGIIGHAIQIAGFTPHTHYVSFPTHQIKLNGLGVTMSFGIDAQKIDEIFPNQHFKRIHFNCPHDKQDCKGRTLPQILKNFFGSAGKLQKIGDRINMALPTPVARGCDIRLISGKIKEFQEAIEIGKEIVVFNKKNKFKIFYRDKINGKMQPLDCDNEDEDLKNLLSSFVPFNGEILARNQDSNEVYEQLYKVVSLYGSILYKEKREYRESYIYKVYDAAASSGYKLVKKRRFDDQRYPGYWHVMTGQSKSAEVAEQVREYIFQRIEPNDNELPNMVHYKSPALEKEHYVGEPYYDRGHILPDDIGTDEDSSNYSGSDEEEFEQRGVTEEGSVSDRQSDLLARLHSVTAAYPESNISNPQLMTPFVVTTPQFCTYITRERLEKALDFMISIEPDPASDADYQMIREQYQIEIDEAEATIKHYGRQVYEKNKDMEDMDGEFYFIVNSKRYRQSMIHNNVASTALRYGWDGIGSWKA